MEKDPLVTELYRLAAENDKIAVYLANTEKHLTLRSVAAERTDVVLGTTWNGTAVVINPTNILYATPVK
ncbi:hypothetical protein CNR29_07820 [Levilactobacillus brevis]|uniref:Uncharacterized protein n=1 Tax=Levilactobacillus brevis TaxID=1580 RepID=A0A2A3TYT7_LEVBR|nr:hypothetical protein [Levilactobacillus brevis]PBQ23931.1 hypothetical protein CNR29_07820 [Levilactobacillus brevis]